MFTSGNLRRRSKPGSRSSALLFSAAAHAALVLLTLLLALHTTVRPVYRQSRCCSVALYWSGGMGSRTSTVKAGLRRARHASRPAAASTAGSNPSPVSRAAANSQPGIAAPQQQATLGTGAGADNAEPAFPVYFPTPGVADRSLLPPAEQKIIVDVSISALGDVTDEKLIQGLGNSLDQVVLQTVKGWRFHPATLNGSAIASVEELVFPFSRDYPAGNS